MSQVTEELTSFLSSYDWTLCKVMLIRVSQQVSMELCKTKEVIQLPFHMLALIYEAV